MQPRARSFAQLTVKSGVGAVHNEGFHVRLPAVVPLLVAMTFSLEHCGAPGGILCVRVVPGGKRGEEDCRGQGSGPHVEGAKSSEAEKVKVVFYKFANH